LDALYDLSWTHQIKPTWSLTTGVNLHTAASRHYNSPLLRDDIIWAVSGGLSHEIGRFTRLDISYQQDWSISQIPDTPGREYHRQIYSLSLSRRW
jgi:long-subunit fatty acid transport protein